MGVVPSRGLTPKTLSCPFCPDTAPEKLTLTSKCPKSGLTADAVVVARPSSAPLASRTTATTVPLSTLAVPATSTGELTAVPPSGLSMMILKLFRMGVAAVVGSEELAGDPSVEAEALAEGDPADGDSDCSTYVVPPSLPHPANPRPVSPRISATPNPFTRRLRAKRIIGAVSAAANAAIDKAEDGAQGEAVERIETERDRHAVPLVMGAIKGTGGER